ncbi:MAG: helix-turn-helix transcriptional regulator [Nitrospinae bacterium]|nr:helix-turn-helix transcriptional regulator [Nitrospinota bacterium]
MAGKNNRARLRAAVKKSGMTNKAVAAYLGVSPRTLRAWLADPADVSARPCPLMAALAMEAAEKLGDGNVSEGIRLALKGVK